MATLTFNGESFTVDHAVKGADYIHGYDANGVLVVAFDGVADFTGFTYDGDYMEPGECLTEHCNTVRYCGGALKTLDGKVVMLTSPSEVEEWANPPMLEGVEYRTTERFNGKPVYRKLVVYTHSGKLGSESSNTDYEIPHGVSGMVGIVRIDTRAVTSTTKGVFPYVGSAGGVCMTNSVDDTNINVRVYKTYWSSPTIYFDLAYIKE